MLFGYYYVLDCKDSYRQLKFSFSALITQQSQRSVSGAVVKVKKKNVKLIHFASVLSQGCSSVISRVGIF